MKEIQEAHAFVCAFLTNYGWEVSTQKAVALLSVQDIIVDCHGPYKIYLNWR